MSQTGSLSLVVLQKLSEGGSYWRLEQRLGEQVAFHRRRSPCPWRLMASMGTPAR